MKIYTEIIMQWDEDNEELVEVSSESHEYNGNIDYCKTFVKSFGHDVLGIGD